MNAAQALRHPDQLPATSGELSGAATGNLSVSQNRVDFAPNVLPSVGTQLILAALLVGAAIKLKLMGGPQ